MKTERLLKELVLTFVIGLKERIETSMAEDNKKDCLVCKSCKQGRIVVEKKTLQTLEVNSAGGVNTSSPVSHIVTHNVSCFHCGAFGEMTGYTIDKGIVVPN